MTDEAWMLFVLFFYIPLALMYLAVLLYPFKQKWIVEWKHALLYGNELWRKRVLEKLRRWRQRNV